MDCICSHRILLRHSHRRTLYWFCPQCRQAMPGLQTEVTRHLFNEQKKEIFQALEPIPL